MAAAMLSMGGETSAAGLQGHVQMEVPLQVQLHLQAGVPIQAQAVHVSTGLAGTSTAVENPRRLNR